MKSIHIPKIKGDNNELFSVKFYRSKSRKYNIFLQKQEIAGFIVPKDTEINIDWERYFDFHYPHETIEIPIYYVNRMLKYVYLKELRDEKRS